MKSEVLLFTVLLALIQSSGGFLLDGPTIGGKQTTGNTQFLTETEFLQAKQVLKQDTNNLRHDKDITFALMTSQLRSKFDLLETKLAEVDNRNKTNNDCISMEEYVALEQKLSNVEQKLANVEQKLTNAQRKNDQMEQENAAVKNELFSLKNNSSKQNIKIEELQKLEFSALQQSVHQNADKIQFLTMNEQARGQDFLALYNITITTGRKLAEMKASTNNLILELKHNQTMEMNHMKQTLDKQLTNLQTSYNATINEFETKEIYLLQQSVHLNEDKLHSLILNEQARGQDVLALYNITTATGRKLTEMKTSTSNLFLEMKNNQTMEMNDLKQDFDNQLASFQTSYNATMICILKKYRCRSK